MQFLFSLAGEAAIAIENAHHFSDLQTAYESLKASQAQLIVSERLNALGEMAAGVAHDFNNVLAGALGRAQLLLYRMEQQECDRDVIQSDLKVIERCALQGAETVRRIQAFTCIRQDMPRDSVDLNEIVGDAVEITRHKWKDECEAQGISITIGMDLGRVSNVAGSSRELAQAVSNLIFNAVEAMPAGGTLQLKTSQREETVLLEISDTGLGLDEQTKSRIFEPFFTTKAKGNGLGLSIVYGIVTQHRGTISVESEKGAGTTFTIGLPLQQDKELHDVIHEQELLRPLQSLRILIVEDDKIIQDLFKEFLKACGHRVSVASSGEEALLLFKSDAFEMVITDLSIGDMSGLSLAKQLKDTNPDVRIILCSGWALQQREMELHEAGIDMAIQKPIKLVELVEVIEKAWNRQGSAYEPACPDQGITL
jgi:nitrogen-specific signal transduction histidine kinase/CheY-like chemotaxis protein